MSLKVTVMREIDRKLKELRPSLRHVAPLTFFNSVGFALFNLVTGILFFFFPVTNFVIVGIISLKLWAILFASLGLVFLFALWSNNWQVTRRMHLLGIFVKTAWLMELVARLPTRGYAGLVLVFVWGLLIYLQFITYVYFTPVKRRDD